MCLIENEGNENMKEIELDIEIINTEKKKVSAKRKAILFSVLAGCWSILIFSQPLEENSIYDQFGIWKGFPIIMFFLLLISSAYILMYVFFMVPSKGRLILSKDFILLKKDKKNIRINPADIHSIKFKEQITSLGEIEIWVELYAKEVRVSDMLNVPFMSEREILRELVEHWKMQGINAKIITVPEKSRNQRINMK